MGLFSRDTDSGDDSDGEKTSFLEERGFIASAIVVGAVLICLVAWFMLGGRSDSPTANPSETPSTAVPTGQPTEEESNQPPPASPTEVPSATRTTPPPPNSHTGGCRAKNPSQAIPRIAAPVAVSWQFEGKMLIPIQAASGPTSTSANGVRSCFAHSPTGAVLAAMVLLGQLQNPEVGIAALHSRVYPGPGRDAAIAEARQTARTPSSTVPGDIQFAGFKVLDYPPNATRTIIQVVADLDGKAYGAMPVTMRWYRSDWYVELQPDGSLNGSVEPDILTSLSGYVRFSGAA
ncbi:hypothetical protein EV649_5422 [Kribbella sp. VKM Ac-2569]|uniref:hypothetical protein n=1 Tax=Kribbella sp. VKM Ac-2569 TaxID=2512220 RepID=UPI00102C865C|nr:hypothetical protein [Kribbella sp. VKM Ac-2569]RZT14647.1 hypothetical protein EV649_5422 [Kribbella sp. VKM Ac-2569]